MQILVYVGGVLILITFAVMLTRRETDPEVTNV
jgi:NADH-quinone oxidoreductase subunit J